MADLSQTPANVTKVGAAQIVVPNSGFPITAGNAAYLASNGTWLPAASTNFTLAGILDVGIALASTPGTLQPVTILTSGTVNLGATLTVGQTYVLSANSGRICPITDLATNSWVTILGVAADANNLVTPPSGCWATNTQHA